MKVSNQVPSYTKLKKIEHPNKTWGLFNLFEDALTTYGYSVYDVETSLVEDGVSIFTHPPQFVLGQHNRYHSGVQDSSIVYHDKISMCNGVEHWVIHVGHNLPYDLNALGIIPEYNAFYWDTSVAQYLLTNQAMTYPSLQDSCAHYKIPMTKEDKVSEMIKAGVEPKDIPESLLMEYLDNDVQMTNALFLAQLEDLRKRPKQFQNLVLQHMQWRTNTYSISLRGLQLDVPRVASSTVEMNLKVTILEKKLLDTMNEHFKIAFAPFILSSDWSYKNDLSLQSPKQIATYLYGGSVDVQYKEKCGTYKTGPKAGTPKYKLISANQLTIANVDSYVGDATDDKRLLEICNNLRTPKHVIAFCRDLLEYRNFTKTLNTYFAGYAVHTDSLGFIHPQFNHTATPTGRLTCTKPNTQNLKGDE